MCLFVATFTIYLLFKSKFSDWKSIEKIELLNMCPYSPHSIYIHEPNNWTIHSLIYTGACVFLRPWYWIISNYWKNNWKDLVFTFVLHISMWVSEKCVKVFKSLEKQMNRRTRKKASIPSNWWIQAVSENRLYIVIMSFISIYQRINAVM